MNQLEFLDQNTCMRLTTVNLNGTKMEDDSNTDCYMHYYATFTQRN